MPHWVFFIAVSNIIFSANLPVEVQAGGVQAALGAWQDAGPGPSRGGQTENIRRGPDSIHPENDVVGAVNRIAPHPTDPNIMYIATVGGGVWKTTNAQGTPPTWTPLTDHVAKSLSMVALTLDHHNPDTVVAGFGMTSSWRLGGDQLGILRSDDAGATWRHLTHHLVMNTRVSSLFIHGDVLVACTLGGPYAGIIRSQDGGSTWVRNAGLTFNACYDMAFRIPSTPQEPLSLGFAWMDEALNPIIPPGLYRTTDGGISWLAYDDSTGEPLFPVIQLPESDPIHNAKVRIHPVTGRVVASWVLNSDRFNAHLSYSDGQGANGTWLPLPKPQTLETGGTQGTNPGYMAGIRASPVRKPTGDLPTAHDLSEVPGGHASLHFSMSMHPANDSYVFIGGDRQDLTYEFNSIGAREYSGRLFVCVIVEAPGESFCVPFTHGSDTSVGTTASFSSPHADSRDLQVDAAGNVIEADDGGIYRRTNPLAIDRAAGGLGDWYGMVGNLKCTEMHDVAYDSLNDVFMTANQDTGTVRQMIPGYPDSLSVSTGDGGDVNSALLTSFNTSFSYSSYYCLYGLRFVKWDTSNREISDFYPGLTGARAPPGDCGVFPFKTSTAVNRIDPARLLVHGTSEIYESFDFGKNAATLAANCEGSSNIDGIVYGGRKNGTEYADLLYVACADRRIVVRSPLLPGDATTVHRYSLSTLPDHATASNFVSLTGDPDDMDVVFAALENYAVVMLTGLATTLLEEDAQLATASTPGYDFRDLSGNIAEKSTRLQTVLFLRGASGDGFLLVGGRSGAFISGPMSDPAAFGVIWRDLEPLPSSPLPNAYVAELVYDAGRDVLLAGTLGRGVQRMDGASVVVDVPALACNDVAVINGTVGEWAEYGEVLAQGVADLTCTPAHVGAGFTDVSCDAKNWLYGWNGSCSFQVFLGCYDDLAGHISAIDQGCDSTTPYCIPSDPHAMPGSGAPGTCSDISGCEAVLAPGRDASCPATHLLEADIVVSLPGDLCAYTIDLDDLATQMVAASGPLVGVRRCAVTVTEAPPLVANASQIVNATRRHLLDVAPEFVTLRLSAFVARLPQAESLLAVLQSPATAAFLIEYFRARGAGSVLVAIDRGGITRLSTVTSDPHFVTPTGRTFDFQGVPGRTYCVVTHARVQLNARFMGASGAGPEVLSDIAAAASGGVQRDDATWMDQVAVLYGSDRVLVEAASPAGAPFALSLGSVIVNGEPLRGPKAIKKLPTGLSVARKNSRVHITLPGTAVMEVEVVRAAFWEAGKGPGKNFLNLKLNQFNGSEGVHGILGQSFDDLEVERVASLEETDYETSGIFATDCLYNRFKGI